MTEMIEYILPIFSLSNALFFIYIVGKEDVSIISWIGLGIIAKKLSIWISRKYFFTKHVFKKDCGYASIGNNLRELIFRLFLKETLRGRIKHTLLQK